MLSPFTSLSRKLAGFKAASHGNVTILFALSMIPVFGLVGAAVDYSRANSARSAMQAAVDATALMLSKDVAELSSSERSKKATDYFAALFNRTEVTDVTLTSVYSPSPNFQIVLSATGAVPTTVSKIIGFQKLNVSVSSTVDWATSAFESRLCSTTLDRCRVPTR